MLCISKLSRSLKVKVKVTQSCPTLCDPMDCTVHGILQASLSLPQQIFPTQELHWGDLHYRQILYQLSYEGSPWWLLGMLTNILTCLLPGAK